MTNPYENLPKTSFWKTGVAEAGTANIEQLWKPKFSITKQTSIVTLGSCFAQHISKSLKANGFAWLDAEPAPAELPLEEHAKQGYGVFSFRTGNIYTAALLRQWVLWATGKVEQSHEVFQDNGRYYDPFRPSLSVDGYPSIEAVLSARQDTLEAIRRSIQKTDLFIFTLGLTEAWLNRDGNVYPMCPGTVKGDFSSEKHYFHNYSYHEIEQDLIEVIDELHAINPDLRILLTVSPVPLTATASKDHVLTATTYSKSVLRAVAGQLAQSRNDTDYFPSYELITTPAFGGRFFERNMRSVSEEGVAFVMGQFLNSLDGTEPPKTPGGALRNVGSTSVGTPRGDTMDICDEIILETWLNRPVDDGQEPPNILLLGDSQMGKLAEALDDQGIRYAGGAIMHGSQWHFSQFVLRDNLAFKALPDGAEERWDSAFRAVHRGSNAQKPSDVWVITNIGMHADSLLSKQGIFAPITKGPEGYQVAVDGVVNYLNSARLNHFELIGILVRAGYKVIWVSDFPIQSGQSLQLQVFVESTLGEGLEKIGASTFLVGRWFESQGGLTREFQSTEIDKNTGEPDTTHGSDEYYIQLSKVIFEQFNIKPKLRGK